MRPSISMTLEPGLQRGVPWGRDLYTFVTSASGHMMRTLQKPRKNRPSKRKVNHRRFLHNMIQRKFADIEAANQRLVSALQSEEEDKNLSPQPPQKPNTFAQPESPSSRGGDPQDPDVCSIEMDAGGTSKSQSDVSVCLRPEPEIGEKNLEHHWERNPNSQPATCISRNNNQSIGRQRTESRNPKSVSSQKGVDFYHEAELFQTEVYDNFLAQSQSKDYLTHQDSDFMQPGRNLDESPPCSVELSPLSLDSCDFSVQMFTDVSACAQTKQSLADMSEGQWTDIMDLFGGKEDPFGGCSDDEAYLESICACQSEAVREVGDDCVGLTDHFYSDRSEVEDLRCDAGEYTREYGYGCDGDQTPKHFEAAGTPSNSFSPALISCRYNTLDHQTQTYRQPRGESCCMLGNCENGPSFAPFEGVAQSFSVPLRHPENRPIPTPPCEDDWLFTDILKDGTSPDCYENMYRHMNVED